MKYRVALILLAATGFAAVNLAHFSNASSSVVISALIPGVCGNGTLEVGEQCDGTAFGGQSCQTLGFDSGTLSCDLSCTFITTSCINNPSGGGSGVGSGGGGGSSDPNITSATFEGKAYPFREVRVLKDGQQTAAINADSQGNFETTLSNISAGSYNFAFFSEDQSGVRSALFAFPLIVSQAVNTKISDIYLAPTLSSDKIQVRQGDSITFSGQGTPASDISLVINSEQELTRSIDINNDGTYNYSLDSSLLGSGDHIAKTRGSFADGSSPFSKLLTFTVADSNVFQPGQALLEGDVNNDGRVNIMDFSIAAFWYKKNLDNDLVEREAKHLNGDGIINISDLSIMAYNWTG